MDDLLAMLKKSVGDLSNSNDLDEYYNNFLNIAKYDLSTDDISENVLNSDIGKATIVAYAIALINNQDIATNQTITLLRNKLADITKGERYGNG